ncbi:MAG: type II toxin-antitoxin system mRNA interferase toxin, RelE/StbE family [Candidatus Omnitrophota bacterium]
MRTLVWGKTFIRALRRVLRKHPAFENDIEETLRLLQENPFASPLATHKLKGKLTGSWACSAGMDIRIVFDFIKRTDRQEDDILLLEIGAHDEVY